jgi:hypothetical protein
MSINQKFSQFPTLTKYFSSGSIILFHYSPNMKADPLETLGLYFPIELALDERNFALARQLGERLS